MNPYMILYFDSLCSKEVCVILTHGGTPREEIISNECNRKSCEVRALAKRVQRCEVHIG
jgi:hypothetical protein